MMNAQKRLLKGFLFIFPMVLLSACAFNRVQKVDPKLYQSLPTDVRADVVEKGQRDVRVVRGKIGKAITDNRELNREIYTAQKEVLENLEEIEFHKQEIRDLKKNGGNDHEVRRLKQELKIARHNRKIALQNLKLKKQERKTLNQKIAVLKAQEKVLLSQAELQKIRSVHEYTQWRVPEARVQVADFTEQLRKFELEMSRENYRLSQVQYHQARQMRKLQKLEKTVPQITSAKKESKPFWKNLFSGGKGEKASS